MILIGQYDSPFVRRVAIAMRLYGIAFEHRPWSTFADVLSIRDHNPLSRVPTLVLDDGDALIDSGSILDYLDHVVGAARAMFPQSEPLRHQALKVAALATGLSDKAVALFYEIKLHREPSGLWVDRCGDQIRAALAVLEADRVARSTEQWFGEHIGHADIAVAASLRHLNDAHPGFISMDDFPTLRAHSAELEALSVFQEVSQLFAAPA